MDNLQFSDTGSTTVSITVLSVTPMRAGKLFALASVEINIDGRADRNAWYPGNAHRHGRDESCTADIP